MKHCLLALLLLSSFNLVAQEKTAFRLRVDHIALYVQNVDSSAHFYGNILHLPEVTNRTKKPGIRWFSLGDGKELHLISTIPGKVTTTIAAHIGLTSPDFDNIPTALDQLHIPYCSWQGEQHTITTRADGIRQLYFQDPDGNWIEVNSTLQQ